MYGYQYQIIDEWPWYDDWKLRGPEEVRGEQYFIDSERILRDYLALEEADENAKFFGASIFEWHEMFLDSNIYTEEQEQILLSLVDTDEFDVLARQYILNPQCHVYVKEKLREYAEDNLDLASNYVEYVSDFQD